MASSLRASGGSSRMTSTNPRGSKTPPSSAGSGKKSSMLKSTASKGSASDSALQSTKLSKPSDKLNPKTIDPVSYSYMYLLLHQWINRKPNHCNHAVWLNLLPVKKIEAFTTLIKYWHCIKLSLFQFLFHLLFVFQFTTSGRGSSAFAGVYTNGGVPCRYGGCCYLYLLMYIFCMIIHTCLLLRVPRGWWPPTQDCCGGS